MKFITFISILLSTTLFAAECLTVTNGDVEVKWTAYKTPAKAGVGGALTGFTISKSDSAKTIREIMKSASITIKGDSVNTKNKARDKKIVKFFFQNAKNGGDIAAKVTKMTNKKMEMDLTFNGVTKTIPMSYNVENNVLTANGFMDVLDFSASKSLKAINKACYALHEGKTWSDVALQLVAKFKPCS
jgi:polyisoprenoid-binding protein YceI